MLQLKNIFHFNIYENIFLYLFNDNHGENNWNNSIEQNLL